METALHHTELLTEILNGQPCAEAVITGAATGPSGGFPSVSIPPGAGTPGNTPSRPVFPNTSMPAGNASGSPMRPRFSETNAAGSAILPGDMNRPSLAGSPQNAPETPDNERFIALPPVVIAPGRPPAVSPGPSTPSRPVPPSGSQTPGQRPPSSVPSRPFPGGSPERPQNRPPSPGTSDRPQVNPPAPQPSVPSVRPNISGVVRFFETTAGVLVYAEIRGLPNASVKCGGNVFGFHIHEGGVCSGTPEDPFAAAGAHYNPDGCRHPQHAGDLPPLFGADGLALSVFLTNRFTCREIIGKTVIIHAMPDDFVTQPSGGAGAKIACGVIKEI